MDPQYIQNSEIFYNFLDMIRLSGSMKLGGGADLKEWRGEKQKAEAMKPRLF